MANQLNRIAPQSPLVQVDNCPQSRFAKHSKTAFIWIVLATCHHTYFQLSSSSILTIYLHLIGEKSRLMFQHVNGQNHLDGVKLKLFFFCAKFKFPNLGFNHTLKIRDLIRFYGNTDNDFRMQIMAHRYTNRNNSESLL